jgi:hypothetical protein
MKDVAKGLRFCFFSWDFVKCPCNNMKDYTYTLHFAIGRQMLADGDAFCTSMSFS